MLRLSRPPNPDRPRDWLPLAYPPWPQANPDRLELLRAAFPGRTFRRSLAPWATRAIDLYAGDTLAASVQLGPLPGAEWELGWLAVHPDFRGHGLARYLVTHALRRLDARIHVGCAPELEPFWRRLGWRRA